jgi:hypothetical protein
VGADDIRALLVKLKATPKDVALRGRVAETLESTTKGGADRKDVDAVLAPLVNLTGHDDAGGLPCLCRDCLARAGASAEADGLTFHRSFVMAGSRVLHFWLLADQGRAQVRASVAHALHRRLGKRASR